MSNNEKNPVTVNGAGADSQNQAGKWYEIVYTTFEFGDLYPLRFQDMEFVFIPTGQSLAKEVKKHVKGHSIGGFPFSRDRNERGLEIIDDEFVRKGIHGGMVCLVVSITLLTSDGQRISGVKPKSIVHLFKDYVKPVKPQPTEDPVTITGAGKDSQNPQGSWYQVYYEKYECFSDLFHHKGARQSGERVGELVFIPTGQSVARHVRKYVKEQSSEVFSFSWNRSSRWSLEARCGELSRKGIFGSTHVCFVTSITLFTSDGQKISGFQPKSIVKLFKDYVKPVKMQPEEDSDDRYDYETEDED